MSPFLFRRLSDEHLGSRLASGEAAAFDELYRRYIHRLAAYGAHLLGDAAAGDDVAQATLLKAYSALRDGRQPQKMRPWLYRIAHNTALDLLARRKELPSADLPELATQRETQTGALVAALAALPERQRRVYVLRELHGLRIDETAAELGLLASQVEQSLFAARNRLAEHLVFGDRLDCVAVRRLSAGPLDGDERRGLKTHLRSCPACRVELGLRGRALSLLPIASVDWLRGVATGLAGGGAPAAAKIGAVVATAGFAAGVPGAAEIPRRDVQLLHPRVHVAADPVAHRPSRSGAERPAVIAHVAATPVSLKRHDTSQPGHEAQAEHGQSSGEHDGDGSGDNGGGSDQHGAAATTEDHHGDGNHEATHGGTTGVEGSPGLSGAGDGGHEVEPAPAVVSGDGESSSPGPSVELSTGHDGGGDGREHDTSTPGTGADGSGDQPPPAAESPD